LGVSQANKAVFTTYDGTVYSTDTLGDGQITVDSFEDGMVSGTFYFNAVGMANNEEIVNFDQGAFYGIVVGGGNLDDIGDGDLEDPDCVEAQEASEQARLAFLDALETEDEGTIMEACFVLKDALEN